jgi:hypothetical protein
MAMTFDATLKDMGRDSPRGFLAAFDRPPTVPVKPLNVDLSTVTALADLILGLGEPLEEIIQLDFQSSAAAWKHADLMVYHALLFAHYRVPVHTVSSCCARKRRTRTSTASSATRRVRGVVAWTSVTRSSACGNGRWTCCWRRTWA